MLHRDKSLSWAEIETIKSALLRFDRLWCGRYQLSADLFANVSEEATIYLLASFRMLLAFSLLLEISGYFLVTLGLSFSWPFWMLIVGILLKVGGALSGSFFQNRAGILLSVELQRHLEGLRSHALEIRSFLADQGCSEPEINALSSLPQEAYQAELNSYQRARILNIGVPCACGLALLLNNDVVTALIVFFLGMVSFPLGEKFFRENVFRKDSELRLGWAAHLPAYVQRAYDEHVWLTLRVNFLSQLPLVLFAFRAFWSSGGQLLSSFFGLTQGLMELTGTLAFQKARATAIRMTETSTHLINALSAPYLLVTPKRWQEHCSVGGDDIGSSLNTVPGFQDDGVLLNVFTAKISGFAEELPSLSCFLPAGSLSLLHAPSGKGKTTLIAALNHLIEHTGEMVFVEKGCHHNAHVCTREEFDAKVIFLREENIEKQARLVDLFKSVTVLDLTPRLEEAKSHYDSMLIDLAWKLPDNLLEHEIQQLGSKRPSVFPQPMQGLLQEIRQQQMALVAAMLRDSGGNLDSSRITPQRHFATLSSGEKRRVLSLLALERCRTDRRVRLVILDEPLTHLDSANIAVQMDIMSQMLSLRQPPSLLVISHHFIAEMKSAFKDLQEIDLFGSFQKSE